nr:hypothetical protein [Halovivax sp. TS33]
MSLAAERCVLYLSQRQITDVADVSSTTLHSRRDELLEMRVWYCCLVRSAY